MGNKIFATGGRTSDLGLQIRANILQRIFHSRAPHSAMGVQFWQSQAFAIEKSVMFAKISFQLKSPLILPLDWMHVGLINLINFGSLFNLTKKPNFISDLDGTIIETEDYNAWPIMLSLVN